VSREFDEFVDLIAQLRGPEGCPWDRQQTHGSIAKNMVEEAYEAVHAIEVNDIAEIREELGDVLLQVVLQAQIASDAGEFTIDDVVATIKAKIVRRHPHVFGDASAEDATAVTRVWDEIKAGERAEKRQGLLDAVPHALPALMRAQAISRKAVSAGFEWENLDGVWEKVHEELDELRATEPGSPQAEDEIGDVLFTIVNLARKQGLDAETALRSTCDKFHRRWSAMEEAAHQQGRALEAMPLEEQETLWQAAKATEKGAGA
jgi:tetrapyrrole methylase family protein / MazG family protein